MEALVYLDLAKTKITDAGLRTLAMQSHPQLAGIDLAETRVSDAGMSCLSHFADLAEICLQRSSNRCRSEEAITAETVEYLAHRPRRARQ